MPRGKRRGAFGFAGQLTSMVSKLKEQRAIHAEALRSIDEIFEKIGITTHLAEPEEKPRRGRPSGKRGPGRPAASMSEAPSGSNGRRNRRRRGRGSYATTASETILSFVKAGGAKGRTTSEISKHWKSEGRSGDAYNALGELVKAKKLKRQNMPGERGSRYTAG